MSSLKKKQNTKILALAKVNLKKARKARGVTPDYGRWHAWADEIYKYIPDFKEPMAVRHFAQDKVPFTHRTLAKLDILNVAYSLLMNTFLTWQNHIKEFSDNHNSVSSTMVKLNDGGDSLISNIFIWHLYTVLSCLSYVGQVKTCLEIGGGNGEVARLWLSNKISPIERYVIVDIPECLFFAEVCLSEEFPGEVGYFNGKDDPETRVLLIPVDLLDKYKKRSDLVLSVGSLQEMTDNWVAHYMQWLDRYDCEYFYSLNYMGCPIGIFGESRSLWSPRPSTKFATKVQNPEPTIIRMMCGNRDFVETLYKREPPKSSLKDWSVYRGMEVNRQTYLEGLELIRQEPRENYVRQFLNVMFEPLGRQHHQLLQVPKELLFLADLIKDQGLIDELKGHVGGFRT